MPYVTDTHCLVWYMTDNPRLSSTARSIFQKVDDGQEQIFIPCIVFFELLYIIERKRIPANLDMFIELAAVSENYKVEPLCLPIIEKAGKIPRAKIADPWDRLIAATSLHLDFPLITHDESLRQVGLKIAW